MMRKWIGALLVILFGTAVKAQELNCTVRVNFERITDVNPTIFKTLERSLTDFINATKWGSKGFGRNERIDCTLFINVSGFSNNTFSATAQIQSSRPIYNSTYPSPLFNYMDKDFSFRYVENENLFYNPNSYDSNLVALVAFYANMMLGLDADSYQKESGTGYYEAAQNMVALAQSGGFKGWSQGDGNISRYFLVNDALSNTFTPFREALYEYHFAGLDRMAQDQKLAKENVIKAIKTLSKVNSVRPNSLLMRVFFDAKSDELVSMFSGGPMVTTTEFKETLNRISPLNSSKWNNIK